ncbi:LOW QUALITY PROTEIN: kinesin-like protein KIN-10B [Prosopis cineraria]|uniref:LOW QUALITY PROTEIN: kinesin-like protein KIN-10B n=1 Tax=Prosopis cineraria TaxID=364024 RepID=UPI00240F9B6A|nr:LOW QUALITY PROTEIN: kinesin-like protein KIN-10B [Prosopis cineraria]
MATPSCSLNTPKTSNSCTPLKTSNPKSISKVRVIIRVRPFLPHEISARNGNSSSCISFLDQDSESPEEITVYLKDPETSRRECYQLDSFFGQEDNNVGQIFHREVSPLISGVFNGCNATVFAYGATGSGKTYTMQGTEEQPGLMPLAMSAILSICPSTGCTAHISYYEVYMDRCYDLLEVKAKEISVMDDKDGQIHLRGLSQVPIHTMSEFMETFSTAVQRRKVAHTGLNDVSSRSHGVLLISVFNPSTDGTKGSVCGKLNLIDLAGNEDNKRTCNEGIRLQESAKINQSLFALSNVIYALNNNKRRVPYRETKLTRILQDSLGGTSRALMVACLNPGEYQESVHTVSLAARSRHISNFVPSTQKQETPKVRVDMEAKLRAWLESKGKTKSSQRLAAFNSPCLRKTPKSINSAKRSVTFVSSVKGGGIVISQNAERTKERAFAVAFRNLPDGEGTFDFCFESPHHGDMDNREEAVTNEAASESNNYPRVESLAKEENSPIMNRRKIIGQPPLTMKIHYEVLSERHSLPSISMRSKITALHLTNSVQGVLLKNCLVQEYVYFLNNASRRELLELKGIGEKMAEYIIDLRAESPIKSLNDLEKIGLSSKQAYNLFTKAARTIFEDNAKETSATVTC